MGDVEPGGLYPWGAAQMGDEKEGSVHKGYRGARGMTLLERKGRKVGHKGAQHAVYI